MVTDIFTLHNTNRLTSSRVESGDLREGRVGDFMHARYYSPYLARFVSVDPVGGSVGSSQSWNRYSYALNNPVKFVDPDGRFETQAFRTTKDENGNFVYYYSFVFKGKLERTNDFANRFKPKWAKRIEGVRRFDGRPFVVDGSNTGVSEVSGFFDASKFENQIAKYFWEDVGDGFFDQYMGKVYTEEAFDILNNAIHSAIQEMGITDTEDIEKILSEYDINKIRKRSKETANILPPAWLSIDSDPVELIPSRLGYLDP